MVTALKRCQFTLARTAMPRTVRALAALRGGLHGGGDEVRSRRGGDCRTGRGSRLAGKMARQAASSARAGAWAQQESVVRGVRPGEYAYSRCGGRSRSHRPRPYGRPPHHPICTCFARAHQQEPALRSHPTQLLNCSTAQLLNCSTAQLLNCSTAQLLRLWNTVTRRLMARGQGGGQLTRSVRAQAVARAALLTTASRCSGGFALGRGSWCPALLR
jgi:hypothetical protein